MWRKLSSVALPGDGPNEDRCGLEDCLAWVIDGATPLSTNRIVPSFPTDAVWLVEKLDAGIRERASTSLPLDELLAEVIDDVATAAERDWLHTPDVPPSAAVGLVRVDAAGMDYLVLADITIAFRDGPDLVEITDNRPDDLNIKASERLSSLMGTGMAHAEAMEEVRPLLLQHRLTRMNVEGGYWVAALNPQAPFHGIAGRTDIASRTVLASDGFTRGQNLFGQWGWETPIDQPELLSTLAQQIRAAELADPDCRAYPRWNVSDDLIALAVEPS